MTNFASNLRKVRQYKGLTQKQLAELSGLSQIMINNYEKGKNIPKGKSIKKLENGLEININRLFDSEIEVLPKKQGRGRPRKNAIILDKILNGKGLNDSNQKNNENKTKEKTHSKKTKKFRNDNNSIKFNSVENCQCDCCNRTDNIESFKFENHDSIKTIYLCEEHRNILSKCLNKNTTLENEQK